MKEVQGHVCRWSIHPRDYKNKQPKACIYAKFFHRLSKDSSKEI